MRRPFKKLAPPPPESLQKKALSLPWNAEEKWLAFIHAVLAVLAPLIAFSLMGCDQSRKGEPVDYGPETPPAEVNQALVNMFQDSYPENTKEGAFVHFVTAQKIAGGAMKALTSETGHTVVKRTELEKFITLEVVEIKYSYRQGQDPEKLSRNFELVFDKPQAQSNAPMSIDPHVDEAKAKAILKQMRKAFTQAETQDEDEDNTKITYHRLRTWESQGPAPDKVRSRENCLEIPNCTLNYRHMSFAMVIWDEPEGNLIHIELVVSPEVPQTIGYNMSRVTTYIPGLVKSCITQMVPIGESNSKTLLNECQEVVDFRFEFDKPTKP